MNSFQIFLLLNDCPKMIQEVASIVEATLVDKPMVAFDIASTKASIIAFVGAVIEQEALQVVIA
jgi:hypothetical protein